MHKPQTKTTPGYRYVIETILFLTYVVFGMTWSAAGSFLPDIMRDLCLGLSEASFVNTSVSAAKIVGPLVAGMISARLGLKQAFLFASFLISLGVLAPVFDSYATILVARFLMGLGGALVVVYFTPIVMEWFDRRERVIVNGLNFVSVSIGMTIGLASARHLRRLLDGSWRNTLLLFSGLSIALLALWLIFGKNRKGLASMRRRGDGEPASDVTVPRGSSEDESGIMRAFANPNTWKLILAYFGLLSVYIVIITYAPGYFEQAEYFSNSSGIYLAPSLALISSIPASFIGIYVSQKIGLRLPLLRISGILVVPGVLLMFFARLSILVFIGAVLTGFGMFFWRPALFSIPQELPGATPSKSAYMMSVFWGVCYALATLVTWLTGVIIEKTGSYSAGFILVACLSVSMLIGAFVIPETGKNVARP